MTSEGVLRSFLYLGNLLGNDLQKKVKATLERREIVPHTDYNLEEHQRELYKLCGRKVK